MLRCNMGFLVLDSEIIGRYIVTFAAHYSGYRGLQ